MCVGFYGYINFQLLWGNIMEYGYWITSNSMFSFIRSLQMLFQSAIPLHSHQQ